MKREYNRSMRKIEIFLQLFQTFDYARNIYLTSDRMFLYHK